MAESSRREFLGRGARVLGAMAGAGGALALLARGAQADMVWQIDPLKCTWCGKCATNCVLNPSAVKCIQNYQLCGYCKLCTGFFIPQPASLDEGAENQLCPTGAIIRKFVEGEYYAYDIDQAACIGCARCVKGCTLYGNGSFFLQIDRKLCVDCNSCSIARECPAQAISKIPAKDAYKLRTSVRSDS